jgi:curved DNA-binding protein CbpA
MAIAYPTRKPRRSTRVAQAVFLTVRGVDEEGKPFEEQTGTTELSFHGCRYFSRHQVAKNSSLTLQELPANKQAATEPHRFRVRVVSVRKLHRLPGMLQVGVEFEEPGNVWHLASPPEDWRQPVASRETDVIVFERDMNELLALAVTGSYYQLLGVNSESTTAHVRSVYYELVRKFHPDRHMNHPEWTGPLLKITDAITLAYRTLAGATSHDAYDKQLAVSGAFTLGEHKSEIRKTAEECAAKGRECFRARNFGGAILWLRQALDIEPQSAKYHALLARSLSAVPQYRREAMEHFQKSVELDPSNTATHFQLAELYEELRLPWRAQCHYQTILETDASHSRARERLRAIAGVADTKKQKKPKLMERFLGRFSK